MNKNFPYTAWTLTPSFNLKQVTIIAKNSWGYGYVQDDKKKSHHIQDLHATKKAALEYGAKKIEERKAKLAASQANLTKHEANLIKAKEQQ